MFNQYKKKCHLGNLKVSNSKLTFQNFGNLSLRINNEFFTIKPSGVNLKKTNYKDYPIVPIKKKKYYYKLRPSVDTDFHLEIYKKFKNIKFLNKYDNLNEMNFTPLTFMEEKDYECFYERKQI